MAIFSTYRNVVKFGRVVFEICERRGIQRDIQTYRHAHRNISHCYATRGEVKWVTRDLDHAVFGCLLSYVGYCLLCSTCVRNSKTLTSRIPKLQKTQILKIAVLCGG